MKKFVLPLVVVLLLAGAGAFLMLRAPHAGQVATWLPSGTVIFEDMPDLHRTEDRWPLTELSQIIYEPAVQAFLERPMGLIPRRGDLDNRLTQLRRIDPTQFFIAVTELSGSGAPKIIAGLSFAGSKPDLDAVVDDLRKKAQTAWPSGKPDIEQYGTGQIETFTTPDFSAGAAYRGEWLFIATDTGLLKATLDRVDGKAGADTLADSPSFKTCVDHLPMAPDNILYARPGMLAGKVASVAMMFNPTGNPGTMDKLKKVDAVALAMKMDGDVMRDAIYAIQRVTGGDTPMTKDALKVSSTDTIVAGGERFGAWANAQMPDPKDDPTGVLQLIESDMKVFTDKGLGPDQLAKAFGPEMGFAIDWPAGSMIPVPVAMVDVQDAATAHKFLDTLATLPLAAGINFTHMDAGGISYYSLPQTGIGIFPLQVTLGLTGKCVIGALSMDAVSQGAQRFNAGSAGLDSTPGYKTAAALVGTPTLTFSYVDTKAIFERAYGLFRGVASFGIVPHLSDYVEIAKLPATDTISRHLSPMVSSGAVKDGGLYLESAGPVTMSQAVAVTAVAAAAVAVPFIEAEIKGQSVSIPGFPAMGGGQGSGGMNPFANPLTPGGSTAPPAPVAAPAPVIPGASASPSAGTP
jgi:hypothetical protein